MAGLVNGAMSQEDPSAAPAGDGTDPNAPDADDSGAPEPDEGSEQDATSDVAEGEGGKLTITPDSVFAKLHLTPVQRVQVEKIVLAGKKVMYSKQSHQMALASLQGPGDIVQKLGMAIAGLMGLLLKESSNSLPPQFIIPAGMVLLADAADFLSQAGQAITDADVGNAIQVFVHVVSHQAGMDSDKLAQVGAQAAANPSGAPGAAAPPGAPPAASVSSPVVPPAGIINQAAAQ